MYGSRHNRVNDGSVKMQPEAVAYSAFDVMVIAASAGGIAALIEFLSGLPECFPVPVVVAQHLPSAVRHFSRLDSILGRNTALPVKWAQDFEIPLPGTVYLAPQDKITVFSSLDFRLHVNAAIFPDRSTPTANPLFVSAAKAFGSRVLALVLSGMLADGADGAAEVARCGGSILAQSYDSAEYSEMPRAAMRSSRIGLAFDPRALAHVAVSLAMAPGAVEWFRVGADRGPEAQWIRGSIV
jgi:two-component system, chemotaxis family, protein-glutamate methylesterase/glutaminase